MMKNVFLLVIVLCCLYACEKSNKQESVLIFDEQFNDTVINESYWNFDIGDGCPNLCGWGNNERQLYTRENALIRDGFLVLTATKKETVYKSAKLTTKDKIEFKYGTVEVRAKLPLGHGLWPAIWMLGHDIDTSSWPDCGEIDIMEYVGKDPHKIHNTLHTPDSYGNSKNTKMTLNKNIEEGFHIYKTNWTKDKIEFFIDDNLVYTFNPKDKNNKTWPYNKPFYLILNLAIGGNFGGPEVDDSIFPQEFLIDYVRITAI